MLKENRIKIGKLNCHSLNGGYFLADGGASFGVLPKNLWKKLQECDLKNRIRLDFNLLLIQSENKNILIDTGIGNIISPKVQKIFDPSPFLLIENLKKLNIQRADIDFVILTHLHFDHAGGVSSFVNGKEELTFPDAVHIIQKKEWDTALDPDELNKGSYRFKEDLALLNDRGNIQFIGGNYNLTSEITLELVGGHSEGMQIIRLESDGMLAYYTGDIIPTETHRHLAVNSAFDLDRKVTFQTKKRVLEELKLRNGILFFPHDVIKNFIKFQ